MGSREEWAFNIAYNAMLLAGRAVMFSAGYRPTAGEGGHVAVVEFLRIRLDNSFQSTLEVMDRMRRQRHRIAYDNRVGLHAADRGGYTNSGRVRSEN